MPVRHSLAALLIACAAAPVSAQDAQGLVAKNLQARGGAAALAAIRNIQFEGRTIFPGDFEVTYKETHARTGASDAGRVDYGVQGLDIIQAYDGHGDGWKVNPLQGRKDAEKMSADEARALADGVLVDGPLLTAAKDGSRVTYLGREDFDGTLAYKLKVIQKDGDEYVYWLDPDTYLEIKIDETRKIRGAQQTTETELGDYEKVAGVYFPMSVESWSQGQSSQRQRTIIATGTANAPIDASYFTEPRSAGGSVTTVATPPDAPKKPNPIVKKATKPTSPRKGK